MGTATEKACAEITRLGAAAVTFDEAQRTKASSDWSRMSPILAEKVPPGRFVADAVVRPGSAADVATVLRVAYEHDVPVTPRGAGTGNYGQATPFEGGILLDLRRLTDVRIGADTVTAGAGARLSAIDKDLRAAGRDIWMYPSTKTSTIGGFVGGGSAGTGSIEHLTTSDGYVVSATVAPMDGSGELFTVSGGRPRALRPHLRGDGRARRGGGAHRPGARLDGRLRGLRLLRRARGGAAGDGRPRPAPAAGVRRRARAGADPSRVGRARPRPAQPAGDRRLLDARAGARRRGRRGRHDGGRARRLRRDRPAVGHVLQPPGLLPAARPPRRDVVPHGDRGRGDPRRPRRVRAVYEGPVHLHLELFARGPGAMVVARYRSEQEMLAGIGRMEAIGMGVHSPHQWYVDRNVELAIDTARRTDPKGLLNPGKLTASPPVDSRVNIGVAR
jgi:hypothetical protein